MTNLLVFTSAADVLEVLTEVDEKSKRSPEIIQYFIVSHDQQSQEKVRYSTCHCVTCQSPMGVGVLQNDLQRLMASSEELCRNMAFSLALRCIQNNPW